MTLTKDERHFLSTRYLFIVRPVIVAVCVYSPPKVTLSHSSLYLDIFLLNRISF